MTLPAQTHECSLPASSVGALDRRPARWTGRRSTSFFLFWVRGGSHAAGCFSRTAKRANQAVSPVSRAADAARRPAESVHRAVNPASRPAESANRPVEPVSCAVKSLNRTVKSLDRADKPVNRGGFLQRSIRDGSRRAFLPIYSRIDQKQTPPSRTAHEDSHLGLRIPIWKSEFTVGVSKLHPRTGRSGLCARSEPTLTSHAET